MYANNPKVANNLTDQFPHPYSKEAGTKFINYASQGEPKTIFAIEVNGLAAGGIGLHLQSDIMKLNAELGYWLAEDFWGKGIVTRAVIEIVTYGFNNLDITRLYARPFGSNIASQKVLEKAGFTLEARFEKTIIKNHQLHDELYYAIRK